MNSPILHGSSSSPAPDPAHILRRKKAQHNLIGLSIFIILAAGGYWYFRSAFSLPLRDVSSLESSIGSSLVKEVQKTVSTPPPLKAKAPVKSAPKALGAAAPLTTVGIVSDTNVQRAENGGLPALQENGTLDSIAVLRLDDMFAKQYFAHVAPDGGSAITTAKTVGYSYLSLGENLALGNFVNDNDVVTAWMNSPGHRANILNSHYTEIGVAARKGVFEGETTWIAVQVFGKPSSDCPSPDVSVKSAIDAEQKQLTAMTADLANKKSAIDAMQPQYGDAYNQKVEEYNTEVADYNALAAQIKSQVSAYNAQVASFNQCLGA